MCFSTFLTVITILTLGAISFKLPKPTSSKMTAASIWNNALFIG
jgi:hypothetical protein